MLIYVKKGPVFLQKPACLKRHIQEVVGKKPSVEAEPNENISMDPAKVIIDYLSFTSCIACPGRQSVKRLAPSQNCDVEGSFSVFILIPSNGLPWSS